MLTGSSSKKKKHGPKLSDTTAYSETHVETIKTADAFRIIIRLKYTSLISKQIHQMNQCCDESVL